jgi:RimJ/RimL family protein N-acetyltransferase
MTVRIRPATTDDILRVYKWRNTPFIYETGHSGQPVEWKKHCQWFFEKLHSPDCLIFIIGVGGQAIGQIRFDHNPVKKRAMVSIYLTEKNTGKGYGWRAINLGCSEAIRKWPESDIFAEFLPDNVYSRKAFKKASFGVYGANKMKYKK